ncbi:MAG TPA: hypothetical protein VMM60_03035 [Ilumatobacter sp.]|nr:hypothetical protein [Ilumatobacter sp.]
MTDTLHDHDHDHDDNHETSSRQRRWITRAVALLGAGLFVAFWGWALFFASKEAVNRIEDRAWAERAQTICADATTERMKLSDYRELADVGPEMIRERAEIIDKATDIIEAMLDEVVAVAPVGQKGAEIVPLWEADYRIYIENRRAYADQLRETGENLPFYETAIAIPISEKVATFAGDNSMSSCAPPSDLAS